MNFNLEEWETLLKKYEGNRNGMNLKVEISIKDGKLSISHTMDEKYEPYWKKMSQLIVTLCEGAQTMVCHSINLNYVAPEDRDAEMKRVCEIMKSQMGTYLEILLNEGEGEFITAFYRQNALCEMQYSLNHLSISGKEIKKWNGDTWNGSGWTKANGDVYYQPLFDEVCKTIL